MANNFMSAATEIDQYVDKKNQCLNKIANLVAEACVTKGQQGKVTSNTIGDVMNLIHDLTTEDKVVVLANALVAVTAQLHAGSLASGRTSVKGSHSDYFSNRGL